MLAIKYVVTVGTFDKDSHKLEKSVEAWQSLINEYVAQHFDGATVYSADGVYKHIDGSVVREPSIRIEIVAFDAATKEKAIALAMFAKQAMNQESVMFEEISEHCDFI